ncbi:hypothetical protein ACS0TY_028151 [Phlomoides rotata]
MDSSWIILVMLNFIWIVHAQDKTFVITDFGAIPDGKTDNKQALANAWKKACGIDGGTVSIPKGTFLVSFGDFEGPCIGKTHFSIQGTLLASSSSIANKPSDQWLLFNKVDSLTFSGSGTVDGNGASAWANCRGTNKICDMNRPTSLKIFNVKNALIQGISLVNSKMFHLNIFESQNVKVENIRITAPGDSPNTDGIHVSRSNFVNIIDTFIGTGDDCVSLGDGSTNVNVSNVFCGPGHGISIGSLGKFTGEQDVSGITVRNCNLSKTTNGLRIKTFAPSQSSNIVSDVTFAEIHLDTVYNPIIIDQNYCPDGECARTGDSSVAIKGVKYINVRGSSEIATGVNIQCSKSKPCQDIDLKGVDITFNGQPATASCSTPAGVQFQGQNVPSSC